MNKPESSGQQVTLAYPKRTNRKEVITTIEINSRDRNLVNFPNSNQFRIRLFRQLKDVVKIQIVGGVIPGCLYNINTGWNSFQFQEDSQKWVVTIPPGKYNYESLCITLNSSLNTLTGIKNSYVTSIDSVNGKLTITRNSGKTSFALLFLTGDPVDFYDKTGNTLTTINTPANLLGFGRADYTSGSGSTIVAPNVVNLEFLLNRCYLYINHDNSQDLNTIERSVGRHQPHAIIYFDELRNNYKFLNKETYEPLYSSYPAPIARIATLDIALEDEFDRLIDLNGRDFSILLEITTLD